MRGVLENIYHTLIVLGALFMVINLSIFEKSLNLTSHLTTSEITSACAFAAPAIGGGGDDDDEGETSCGAPPEQRLAG